MPGNTFFFYDLETSGLNPRHQRIMQFAGQRTDMDLRPIGEPYNLFVKISEDILPDPQAVLITGTTPQKTLEEGISEPEFAKLLVEEIFTPGTTALGFNTLRFDDEFVRHTLWRNFYDPYEWAWSDNRSRWDLLDLVRMTRALRPDGIEWPFAEDGSPVNKLELLSKANNLEHTHAHDALSDVEATIGIARLISEKQPRLFSYLLSMRDKKEIKKLITVDAPQPFVYSSGKYGKKHLFTTIALPIAGSARPGAIVVYDLRHDPTRFKDMSLSDMKKLVNATYQQRKQDNFQPLPVKELAYNKCPAVAPLGVLDENAWQRLELSKEVIQAHAKNLTPDIVVKIVAALSDKKPFEGENDVETKLYDSFIMDVDKVRSEVVRKASNEDELADLSPQFVDDRYNELLVRYKARNFPRSLTETEQQQWQAYREEKFAHSAPAYVQTLQALASKTMNNEDQYLLQELQLWLESTAPSE